MKHLFLHIDRIVNNQKRALIVVLLGVFMVQFSFAQEEDGVVSFSLPVRNSMTFNKFAINPTFSFVREQHKYISVYNKREWVQFDDAPQTYLLGYSGRFAENMGAGIGLFQQNYGVLTTFGGVLNFAYNAQLSHDNNLTFGLNVGAYKSGLNSGKVVINFPDPSLDHIPSHVLLTANPGINYGTAFFDIGVSINNLVLYNLQTSEIIKDDPRQTIQGHVMYTGYLDGRGFFENAKFSGLLRSEIGKESTIISGTVMMASPKGIWAQAGFNSLYGASLGLGLNISEQIAIEYNFERAMGNMVNFGPSHDVTLAFRFKNNSNYLYHGDEEVASIFTSDGPKRVLASSKPKEDPEVRAQKAAEAKAKREEQRANAVAKAEERTRQAEEAKIKREKERTDAIAKAEERAKLAEETKAKAAEKAQAKLEEEAKAREARQEQIAQAAKTRTEAQEKVAQERQEAQEKKREEAQAKADEKIRLAQEAKAKDEREAKEKYPALERANAMARERAEAEARLTAAKAKTEQEPKDQPIGQESALTEVEVQENAKTLARERAEAEARLAAAKAKTDEDAAAKAEQEAKDKLAAQEKAKVEADARAKAEEARIAAAKAEQDAKDKLAAQEKAKAEADAKAKAEEARIAAAKAEQDAKDKLAAQEKAKAEAEAQAQAEEAARIAAAKAEQDAKDKLAAQEKAKAEAEAKAKAEEAARIAAAKAEQDAKDRLAAQERAKAEAEAQAQAEEAARIAAAKAEQEAKDKLAAQEKAKAEADARAKAEEEARVAAAKAEEAARIAAAIAEQEAQEQLIAQEKAKAEEAVKSATDANAVAMKSVVAKAEDSKTAQDELLNRFNEIVESKNKELQDLIEENDLGEQGIYREPTFKNISEENNKLATVRADLDKVIRTNNNRIEELEQLYNERRNTSALKNDEVTLEYEKTLETLKADQSKAIQTRAQLTATLDKIIEDTEIERKRRIKRAHYTSEEGRYLQDRATLQLIKENTNSGSMTLKPEDFDSGEKQGNNIQIIKNVEHLESGFYMIVAVHSDVSKRDEFVRKAVLAGQTDIDFFYDVNTSKYYIYYKKADSVNEAIEVLKTKGDQPYNGQMSIVRIEN